MRFSIVIANYNSGTYLEEAILSVLNQDYTDYELIMVDAGSTDESKDAILKYQDRFSWWCSEKDKGQSDAFNKGFSHAKGDYFFWLNADDLLMPGALSGADKYLSEHKECKWLTFNTIFMNKDKEILFAYKGAQWCGCLMKKGGPQVDSATSIFHRELYDKSQKFDLRFHYAMDIDLWMQFINLGYKFERLDKYFYVFRIHENSKTTKDGYKQKAKEKDRIEQSILIREKNNYKIIPFYVFISKIYKLFTCKFGSMRDTRLLKGKKIEL